MRIAPTLTLSPEQRATLEQWSRSRSLPARVVERARLVLSIAEGQQDKEVAAAMKMTAKKVARWRKRFRTLGVEGLQHDAPRPGRTPKILSRIWPSQSRKPRNGRRPFVSMMRRAHISNAWRRSVLRGKQPVTGLS